MSYLFCTNSLLGCRILGWLILSAKILLVNGWSRFARMHYTAPNAFSKGSICVERICLSSAAHLLYRSNVFGSRPPTVSMDWPRHRSGQKILSECTFCFGEACL